MIAEAAQITLDVNGRRRRVETTATATLLTVLREDLAVTSPKRGCNQGVCGACTVEVDGWPVRACLSLAADCEGRPIRTIEGIGDAMTAALQRQFVAHGAVQCGFCTSGMLVTARSLLRENAAPSIEEVQGALSGNICRCTGYRRIVDAVRAAAEELQP